MKFRSILLTATATLVSYPGTKALGYCTNCLTKKPETLCPSANRYSTVQAITPIVAEACDLTSQPKDLDVLMDFLKKTASGKRLLAKFEENGGKISAFTPELRRSERDERTAAAYIPDTKTIYVDLNNESFQGVGSLFHELVHASDEKAAEELKIIEPYSQKFDEASKEIDSIIAKARSRTGKEEIKLSDVPPDEAKRYLQLKSEQEAIRAETAVFMDLAIFRRERLAIDKTREFLLEWQKVDPCFAEFIDLLRFGGVDLLEIRSDAWIISNYNLDPKNVQKIK